MKNQTERGIEMGMTDRQLKEYRRTFADADCGNAEKQQRPDGTQNKNRSLNQK